jgi:hypothetical protein
MPEESLWTISQALIGNGLNSRALSPILKDMWQILKIGSLFFVFSLSVLSLSNEFCLAAESMESQMYLLATQDQVKLLNQKLEYKVHNAQSIQVGNLLISTNNLKMTLDQEGKATLEGPLQFMVGGKLILKDPHGRALWSVDIDDPKQIQLVPPVAEDPPSVLRKDSARYLLEINSELEGLLLQNSFFSFCTFIETKVNRIQACSPTYSLDRSENKWNLQSLENAEKENVIIVNGTEVNEHGIIQFDQNIKTVSLAANLSSGLTVEVKTDFIELDLLDIFYDEEKSLVHLKLREQQDGKKKVYPWNSQISLKDPFLYIEALGQVPLRQELEINKQNLPLPADRPSLQQEINKTYASNIQLRFKKQAGIIISARNKGDKVKAEANEWIWEINNLKLGLNKPRLLNITANSKKIIGAYEIERARSWDLNLQFVGGSLSSKTAVADESFQASETSTGLRLQIQRYFEGFFDSTAPAHHLRWSGHFSYAQNTLAKSKIASTTMMMDLGYRFSENFHHRDPGSSVRWGLLSHSSASTDASLLMGIKLAHDGPNSFWNSLLGDAHETYLGIYPLCLNSNCKGTQVTMARWQSRYDWGDRAYWSWGLGAEQWSIKKGVTQTTMSLYDLSVVVGYEF